MRTPLPVLALSLALAATAGAQLTVINLTFPDASQLASFVPVGDAANFPTEVSQTFVATGGNPGGYMNLSGTNTSIAGRGYSYLLNPTNLAPYGGNVTVTFDLILTGPLNGAAVQFLTNNPGPGFVPLFNLETQGLNPNTWTTFSLQLPGITVGTTSFTAEILIAAGAFPGAGGAIGLDNFRVEAVPEPSTWALLAGLAGLAVAYFRRR